MKLSQKTIETINEALDTKVFQYKELLKFDNFSANEEIALKMQDYSLAKEEFNKFV